MKDRMLNGYKVIYKPNHPNCMTNYNWGGYVYEHIFVATEVANRPLGDNEVVHHLDGNRANNHSSNLIIMGSTEHHRLHKWISNGASYEKSYDENGVNSGKSKVREIYCLTCGKVLKPTQTKYCSTNCIDLNSQQQRQCKVVRPSKEILQHDISTMSWLAIGRKYGVSDNAVRKWARKLNLL